MPQCHGHVGLFVVSWHNLFATALTVFLPRTGVKLLALKAKSKSAFATVAPLRRDVHVSSVVVAWQHVSLGGECHGCSCNYLQIGINAARVNAGLTIGIR
jgi:hypothetical protein